MCFIGFIISFFAIVFFAGFDFAFLTLAFAFTVFFALAATFAFGADFLAPLFVDFFADLAILVSPPGPRFEKDAQKYADAPKTKNVGKLIPMPRKKGNTLMRQRFNVATVMQ